MIVIYYTILHVHLLIQQTGVFDLRLEEGLHEWLPERHFLGTALAHLKKAFYLTTFDSYSGPVPNELARTL